MSKLSVGTEDPAFSWGLDVYMCPSCHSYLTPRTPDEQLTEAHSIHARRLTRAERRNVAETVAANWRRWAEAEE